MSTHGIAAKGDYALGSAALKVMQTAPCQVLLRRIDWLNATGPSSR